MSDYEFYAGFEGAGDDGTQTAPDSLYSDVSAGDDHNLNTFTYEDAEWGPAGESDTGYEEPGYDAAEPTHDDAEAAGYDSAGIEDTEHGDGLLDGLEFDLSALDLGSLTDMAFDATYDLIGSDPAESGWWQDLASDHNHDGAYETISADDPYAAA
jgi:hypothetical protein